MIKRYFIFILLIILSKSVLAQTPYVSHYTLGNNVATHVIIDKITRTKFILDSAGINITAIDSFGKQLWKTDPWKDNKIETYRKQRPVIVDYLFSKSDRTQNKEVIWIVYNNTQFGYLEKATGRFTFLGQD